MFPLQRAKALLHRLKILVDFQFAFHSHSAEKAEPSRARKAEFHMAAIFPLDAQPLKCRLMVVADSWREQGSQKHCGCWHRFLQ